MAANGTLPLKVDQVNKVPFLILHATYDPFRNDYHFVGVTGLVNATLDAVVYAGAEQDPIPGDVDSPSGAHHWSCSFTGLPAQGDLILVIRATTDDDSFAQTYKLIRQQ
jgi:hypothetical protein